MARVLECFSALEQLRKSFAGNVFGFNRYVLLPAMYDWDDWVSAANCTFTTPFDGKLYGFKKKLHMQVPARMILSHTDDR
jgi:hypothetical protein